jgi:signal transduction histidine kinase
MDDALLVVVMLVLATSDFVIAGGDEALLGQSFTTATYVVGLTLPQPLWWRRTQPVLCMATVLVLGAAFYLSLADGARATAVGPWACAAAAAWGVTGWAPHRPWRKVVGLVTLGSAGFGLVAGAGEAAWGALAMLLCAVLGATAARRRAREHALRDEVESERRRAQAQVSAALEDERLRIARDLHDGVGHHVTVLTMHAIATRRRLASSADFPAAEDAGIRTVEDAGRRALADLRSLVAAMRSAQSRDPDETSPQCDLVAVPALVHAVRATGMSVTLSESGEPAPLGHGARVSAYRVVQEGLSNCLRHAGDVPVEVTLTWSSGGLHISVENGGATESRALPSPPGHGLLGLRERVSRDGGTLTAGPTPAGGFRLQVWLPADEVAEEPQPRPATPVETRATASPRPLRTRLASAEPSA